MSKKHIFLSIVSKITIFACVFCAVPAWSDTTTCDIDFTPVTGNSWQNGTPTPTNPVAIESIGTKIGNKYQIPVVAQGKNLVDLIKVTRGYYYDPSGVYTQIDIASVSDFIECKPSTNYTISGKLVQANVGANLRINYFDSNKTWLSQDVDVITRVGNFSYTFTPPANVKYIRFSANHGGTTYFDWDVMQLEQGSVATPYAPYSAPTTTPIYLNAPLRKVGDYADVLDYKNGTITRNVGVKVLDGTESWVRNAPTQNAYYMQISDAFAPTTGFYYASLCSHYPEKPYPITDMGDFGIKMSKASSQTVVLIKDETKTSLSDFTTYLASEYANGTPVTAYYPLATPMVEQIENWSCPVPITDIKIATTKMVDEEFAQAEANLAATVQTIESVVSRTIAQTGQIATLHEEKQTRPDETCPANMKCLLVQDEDGTPHWYPIIEP